jgi:hypothetical protein
MKRSTLLLAFLLLAVLVLAACGSPSKATPAAASAQTPSPQTALAKAAATPAPRPTGQGGLPVPQPGQLQSYVAQIEFKQEIVKPTPAAQTWVTMEMRYQGRPLPGAYTLTIGDRLNQKDPARSQMKLVLVDQDAYLLTADQGNKWIKVSMQDNGFASQSSSLFDPNKLAESAPAAIFAPANVIDRREAIDGQETTHYRVKDAAVAGLLGNQPAGNQVQAGQADLWISNRGNYLKQYTLDATVQQSDGREVRQTGKVLVTGENKPVQVATPGPGQIVRFDLVKRPTPPSEAVAATPGAADGKGAQDALKTVPVPPKGSTITSADTSPEVKVVLDGYGIAGLPSATYATTGTVESVFKYYRDQMVKLGWSEVMNQAGKSTGQPSLLMFSKDRRDLQMLILPDVGKQRTVVFMQIEG